MSDRLVSVRWLCAATALLFAVVTTLIGESQGAPTQFLLLDATGGLLFILSGLVAWSARPEVPTGPLLMLSGVLWFVGSYAPMTLMPASLLGFAFERYYDVVLAFLVLTFPRGWPRGSRAVVLVVLASAYVVRTAFRLFVGCTCTGENPVALFSDDQVFNRSQLVTSWVIVGAAMGVLVLAVQRLRTSSAAAHRYLAPVVVSGSVAALVATYDAFELAWFIQTGGPVVDLGEPGNEILAWSIIAAVGLVPLGFLIGALQRRGGQEGIARMAVDLDGGADPGQLRAALRHALGDPTLELYLRDGQRGWRTAVGRLDALPRHPESASTVIEGEDGPLAVVVHDAILREDPGLVAAAVAVLRLAIENERLGQVVQDQLDEVRASRARLIQAAEDERRRIVRDLHDGAQQRLIAVALSMQQAREAALRVDPVGPLAHRVDEAITELLAAVDELRRLARGIHPAILTEEGLVPAVAGLARRSSVPVQVDIQVRERLPSVVEATAYFIVAEALTNVTRHADAQSAVVCIARNNGHLDVEVRDDGAGGADGIRGSGLTGMADRLDALSGSLVVESPVGGGTRLKAVIPCA
jgi:signal transduction histidine kinase